MMTYKPTITTMNLWPSVGMHVGSERHNKLIDEIANIKGPIDEQRLLTYYSTGENYEDAARHIGW